MLSERLAVADHRLVTWRFPSVRDSRSRKLREVVCPQPSEAGAERVLTGSLPHWLLVSIKLPRNGSYSCKSLRLLVMAHDLPIREALGVFNRCSEVDR